MISLISLKILFSGNTFFYLQKKMVKYRKHSNSISNHKDDLKFQFSNFPIKVEDIIKRHFLKYYTFRETVLFKLEYEYYHYYLKLNNLNLVEKMVRRCWYFFVEQSLNKPRKALNFYTNKQMKIDD
jgi:hypothetical protein